MELTKVYDREFYGDQQIAYNSAKCILDLVSQWHKPRSVIDIGCGLGTWLKVWQELDSSIKIVGLDGNDVESNERSHTSFLCGSRSNTGLHTNFAEHQGLL